jgi:hypothetical protein
VQRARGGGRRRRRRRRAEGRREAGRHNGGVRGFARCPVFAWLVWTPWALYRVSFSL